MKGKDFTIPNGQSLRKVRDFVSWGNSRVEYLDSREVASYFGSDITDALLATGLIEPYEHRGKHADLFQVSALGGRLAHVRLVPRIDRAKAQGIVVALLERVRRINGRSELLYRVAKVHAFGSFITDAPDLGDIDVAVELQGKRREIEQAGGDWVAANLARAKASGKSMGGYGDMLYYGEREVRLLLKGRDRYLSFHPFAELERLQVASRCLFPDTPSALET
jgi:hypothetical protein